MKLFLTSEARHPESISQLKKLVGGSFLDKKIVYIPTASNGVKYGEWIGQSFKTASSLGAQLTVVEFEKYQDSDNFSSLFEADILWVSGGMGGYLLYWMRRTEFDKKLPMILDKGTIYLGSSSGGMVCSRTMYASEWYIGDPEPGASLIPGLGLVSFEIYPHYEESQLTEIEKNWKKGDLYLLKDGESILVEDNNVTVLGEKRIISK